ncbi:hypothetical protein C4544_07530 [candidate division WS5 bacterium]|uniref:Phage P1-related protein n=1 Tax=candidate division WS5 bacterium TaxID=2093353 RepID=A0A419D9L1_9BACT|nr:MAG: hypothetical protein C4544_07530 [candidate division WS5 bacterium]
MNCYSEWLPEIEPFEKYGGDWDKYLDALHTFFKNDFIDSKPCFRGRRLGLKKHPLEKGKEATFWHLISEGKVEKERTPDLRRCERIRWPRPVIENDIDPAVKVWENKRKTETRILLWLEQEEYLVVLADRKEYILPWTAYMVTKDHQKIKLEREYQQYKKANAAR